MAEGGRSSRESVDPTALTDWMRRAGLAPAGPVDVTRIGSGNSNLTYRVGDGSGRAWVLRRPPDGPLLASAHDILREARIVGSLAGSAVPVPEILGILPVGEIGDDVPAVLMSWIPGLVVDDAAALPAAPPGWRRTAALSLIEAMAAIHEVNLADVGLADLASRSSFAARQLRRWEGQWRASADRDRPELDRLTGRLGRAQPAGRPIALVHGDLHLRNVMLAPATGEVAAVLDWELSTLGDPLADLGFLLACWPRDDEPSLEGAPASRAPGFPERAELIEAYAAASRRDLTDLPFWHVLGLWKLAIIGLGLIRRSLHVAGAEAARTPTQGRIDQIVAHAHALADDAGMEP